MRHGIFVSVMVVALVACASRPAGASAIVAGFNGSTLAANDDLSTGSVAIGFPINFFGTTYNNLFVNNNGNVTFLSALGIFTPFPLLSTATPIIAPFFADVDTRFAGDVVSYGAGTFGGNTAFGVNWVNVDYFASSVAHTNRDSFQLIIENRADTGSGNFDFLFNYDLLQWEAGTASGSTVQGCGGSSARAGYSNGLASSQELPGSGVNGAFLDSGTCVSSPGSNALILNSLNSNVAGRYIFNVRNGEVIPITPVPEPTSVLLFGTGLLSVARRVARRRTR